MKYFWTPLPLCLSLSLFSQDRKSALFLGNSYTAYNNLPQMVASIAQSFGDTLDHQANTPGGYTLELHTTNANSLNLIRQGGWDFVCLQEQSQRPSFPIGQVQVETFPYAAELNDSILSANPCAETVFYMTWGRENGDFNNCPNWPPVCTYQGMQELLRERYLTMADDNDAVAAPVGAVWNYIRTNYPAIDLYTADQSHPSYAGSYVAACTFYATIFRKSPSGSTFIGSLSAADAQIIQDAAALIVLDSMDNWYIGTYDATADFTFVENNLQVDFTNTSVNASSYEWSFGDGNSSILSDPSHQYPQPGMYIAELIAHPDCSNMPSDTLSLEINALATSIVGLSNRSWIVHQQPNGYSIQIQNGELPENTLWQLINASGQLLDQGIWTNQLHLDFSDKASGIYHLMIQNAGEQKSLSLSWFR